MLNYLWSFMILAGLLFGVVCGNLGEVTQGLIESAQDAVALGITMLGMMTFWCGIMEIGKQAGLLEWFTQKMNPLLNFLFPDLKPDHPARAPIAVNIVANVLGLGMASTPAGLLAMQELDEKRDGRATNAMCTFLVLNISSLQLIPVSMIAYRSQYGSPDPGAVIGPALLATSCSTLTAVIFCKIMQKISGR